jgi:DegV family protein with EDD domain
MQREAAIVTGSVGQVPQEIAEELKIHVIPFIVNVNGEEYRDGIDITPGELYRRMRVEQVEVHTAAPTVGDYYTSFKNLYESGIRKILCITLSNKLSSAYSAAVNAANLVQSEISGLEIVVFDSLRAAVPQGFLAIEAAKKINIGESFEDVVAYVNAEWKKTGLNAALDTLFYLAQGGRIGKAANYVGSALKILPILQINDDGVVAPATVLRNKAKIIPTIINRIIKETEGYTYIKLGVMQADAYEAAEELREEVQKRFPDYHEEIRIDEFTPVMGAHTGPGLIGLGYLYE